MASTEAHDRPRAVPRRGVDWRIFLGVGVALGILAGAAIHLAGPAVPDYGTRTSLLFFAAFGAMIGGLLGGLLWTILDSLASRRRPPAGR